MLYVVPPIFARRLAFGPSNRLENL